MEVWKQFGGVRIHPYRHKEEHIDRSILFIDWDKRLMVGMKRPSDESPALEDCSILID